MSPRGNSGRPLPPPPAAPNVSAEDLARREVHAAAAAAPNSRIFTGMSFVFLLNRDGLAAGNARTEIFSKKIREHGGLVYEKLRPSSTTHIITGKRHDHRKLLSMLADMNVDAAAAKIVSVVC